MMWDKLFWIWFLITSVIYVSLTYDRISDTSVLIGMIIVSVGILKFADEDKKKKLSKRLLSGLRK
jgi:hypothetical protein